MRRIALVSVVALGGGMLVVAGPPSATAQTISGLVNPPVKNAGNSPDEFQDGTFESYQRTSITSIITSSATSFRARYREVIGVDEGFGGSDRTEVLNSDYTVQFNVTAPQSYQLNITTSLNGAFTTTDDGGGVATADLGAVTGTHTGGTLVGGTLNLSDPGSLSTNSGGNVPFLRTSSATITGVSLGVAQAHTLRFTWSGSCRSAGGIFTNGDECAVRGGIAIGYSGETAGDYPGVGGRNIDLDGHFVSVHVVSLCGNGILNAGEQCDLGAGNGSATTCCTSGCLFRSAGSVCRATAGVCDLADLCTGTGGTCPADAFQPPSTICRLAGGGCDITENCTGTGVNCPPDAKDPPGTPCGSDGNPCTLDQCDGVNNACQHPAGNAGAVCRASAGVCDPQEVCNGTSTTCPPDLKSTAVCRPSNGVCDVAESCDGVGNACPPDGFQPATTTCRAAAGVCDVAESCAGTSAACPPDSVSGAFVLCRAAAGVCDLPENCDGVGVNCPADLKSTALCRAAGGVCDVAESCDGAGNDCPPDAKQPPGTACPDDGNPCSLDECDGSSNACQHPAGNAGALCRASAGVCDVAENCDGASTTCPPDAKEPSGTPCADDGNPCSLDECDGSSNACQHPAGNAGALCRASAGVCDVAENCDGSSTACPPDGFASSSVECRASAGVCDVAENCTGSSAACPPDGFAAAGVECRAASGVCDVAEQCTGTGAACPPDSVAGAFVVCRPAAGDCDVADNCDGVNKTCPADQSAPNGTPCSDGNVCTTDACQSGTCVGTFDPSICLDDFQCYKVRKTKGAAGFVPVLGLPLADEFESGPFDVKKPADICNPASKNAGTIFDAVTHLKAYKIALPTGQPKHVPQLGVLMTDQFGTFSYDTKKAQLLLVPTAKNLVSQPPPPNPLSHAVDHFKCYKVRVTRGTPKFPKGVQVTIADQFTATKTLDVKKPRFLCTPVDKNGEGIKVLNRYAVCYKVKTALLQPVHVPVIGFHANNQFGPEILNTKKEDILCVPAERP
jgi:hypothetical protein